MPLALVSVYDKSGLAAFATRLAALGFRFLASGGSAAALRAAGLSVTDVSVYTNSDEMLGGRVKTLHPAIHGGILARDSPIDRAELAARGWEPIDLVVVNLYPFEETVARPGVTEAQAIEEVDIGGVTLIRAAAKNHGRVTLAADPHDYDEIAKAFEEGPCPPALRRRLAAAAFARTASYDRAIATWMAGAAGEAAEEGQATEAFQAFPSGACATERIPISGASSGLRQPLWDPRAQRPALWAGGCSRGRNSPTTTSSTSTRLSGLREGFRVQPAPS